ncbi:unnamed protein product [Rhizophagus irregularis]|uniref:Uncharacterized protein n=1 Tax=Rhizophagus irregularis TaxID=588596 RepID=A0A2I1G6V5_9GLOM|nr:hypothetical protein RhiirA4_456156 [Rhizophagus irregularis]CAB4419036.1 unnamed protein product [Rhizophagus irregularis]CAB4419415.1 unnamed protein product [Rhizophagus irregularis]
MIDCCHLALVFGVINVLQFVFYFKYSLTLGENEAKLERELARFEGEQNKDRIEFHKEMARFEGEQHKDRIEFHKEMARIASEIKTAEMLFDLCKNVNVGNAGNSNEI